ncbi:MAG: MFS transporter [Actinomycetota bacterium]|jgi:MFS family permease|nr:MFS transporter [Actinomycetota bacterium]
MTVSATSTYEEYTNDKGRTFRIGESPKQLLGYPRGVVLWAAWLAIGLAGVLEYTWSAFSGSLAAAHHWGPAPTFWLFSFFVVFESFVQIGAGFLRKKGGIFQVRNLVVVGGVLSGVVAYTLTAYSTSIWTAYLGYCLFGGIGAGLVYNSCVNIVSKWYPEKKGWRTGFVNGAWAYGSVPFIVAIGGVSGFTSGAGVGSAPLSPASIKNFILVTGLIMTVGIIIGGLLMKDPPQNWWPAEVDPRNWSKHTTRDLRSNPPAYSHYSTSEMWRTPQPKWMGIQFALFVGSSLFGVAFYFPFALAEHLGVIAGVAGAAGFALNDGVFRPLYGWISEFIGRRRTMTYAYSLNAVFQVVTLIAGLDHLAWLFIVAAVISGGLSGANFPMTALMVADYYGENNNAMNYGSVYAWKALGGSFAGGGAALIMTGTLYGTATFHWTQGFIFGAALAALAAVVVYFKCKPPTVEQWSAATSKAALRTSRPEAVGGSQPATI